MLTSDRLAMPHGRLLFRGDLVTVRETTVVERCATRHQVVFSRSQPHACGIQRMRLGPPSPAVDPTRVLLLNAGDAPRRADHATGHVVIGLAPGAFGGERAARPFAHAQATVGPRVLLALHVLRAALARPLADVHAPAVDDAALALVAQVLAVPAHRAAPPVPNDAAALGRLRRRRDLVTTARDTLARAPGRAHHLADVAAALDISPSHLAHVFTAEVGMPLHRYLLHLRLAVALERLADGEPQLSAVALDLGFATHSHFSAAFRRWCGVTPAAARAMLATGRALADVMPRRAAS
ncbi:Helix-turn-helix, AraC domain-containing protein (plasmid) [Gemmatirosa kalamazoonensis]|uniref:Helix-turn-helix, AraC domain-containing protein n=1 Tax=Gemmatirosa kalamazoonensis TaxID=861299 RepID=W0RSK1_9BACT|nr:helix-turn-helix transcriptional regulator [Gemmatirosa kalamazoonensis]AHG93671.1 Helix-turn-helix, AraC domain-containing protein [Gemmatirosa kalamazoonensis]